MVFDREPTPNPIEDASFFSKATFLFTLPLFRKREVNETDIYQTLENFTSSRLGNQLEAEWEKEQESQHPSLARALLHLYGRQIVMLGIFVFAVELISMIAKPLLVGKIVKFFDAHQTEITLQNGIIYCSALVGWLLISGILLQLYSFKMYQLILKIKIACSTLIYRKLIKTAAVEHSRGQAITLITKDVNSSDIALHTFYLMVLGIVQVAVLTYLMYTQVGISALIGISLLLLYCPFQAILSKSAIYFRLRTAALTDLRFRKIQEVLTAASVMKMYGWEKFHTQDIADVRKKEVLNILVFNCIQGIALSLAHLCWKLIFCVIILTYVSFGKTLTAEKVFMVTTCIQELYGLITIYIPSSTSEFGNVISAIRRINIFLNVQEMPHNTNIKRYPTKLPYILLKDFSIQLGNTTILSKVNLYVDHGLTLLTGQTGVGKTTLLHALVGEVQNSSGIINIFGTVSYAAQDPWLFPGTIRKNILFGEKYDRNRYKTIIEVCGLKQDMDLFTNGDLMYLTDRGLNLSKGQKTRINLARCVYKKADIYFLDDCLSSLDIRVGNQVFYQCIKEFLKDKICILVTHNKTYIKEADQTFLISHASIIRTRRASVHQLNLNDSCYQRPTSIKQDTRNDTCLLEALPNDVMHYNESKYDATPASDNTGNIFKELNKEGKVAKKIYCYYFSSGGGLCIFITVVILLAIAQGVESWASYFLSIWVNAEQELSNLNNEKRTNSTNYNTLKEYSSSMSTQYFAIIVAVLCLAVLSNVAFGIFGYLASVNIHNRILSKICNAPMHFFAKNLSGNVLNKLSRDLSITDEQLPNTTLYFLRVFLFIMASLVLVSTVKLYLVIPSALLLFILYFARRYYLPTGRSIQRLLGSTRSPVIGHLNATADGLMTIRCNQMQSIAIHEFEKYQDIYNSAMHMSISTQTAFGLFLDILSTCYIGIITFSMLLLRNSLLSSEVGLGITQSLSLSGFLLKYGVKMWAEIETRMTSVERLLPYTKIHQEDQNEQGHYNLPFHGKIVYKDVSLRYPFSGDLVLEKVNFVIEPKKKLGVVGRTGAGKSSLVSVLFRLYDFDGSITIDGIDTSNIGIKYLRSKVSVIPQDPYFFTGTIRQNLDPYNQFSDKQLHEALEEVGMKTVINVLTQQMSEGGNNLSTGQKQLICLARALLHNNNILVLDEATANLDTDTDAAIQKIINSKFLHCTVITIAHRLQSIIDSDVVLVMDQGRVVEYGDPKCLLKDDTGHFYNMIKCSGILSETTKL